MLLQRVCAALDSLTHGARCCRQPSNRLSMSLPLHLQGLRLVMHRHHRHVHQWRLQVRASRGVPNQQCFCHLQRWLVLLWRLQARQALRWDHGTTGQRLGCGLLAAGGTAFISAYPRPRCALARGARLGRLRQRPFQRLRKVHTKRRLELRVRQCSCGRALQLRLAARCPAEVLGGPVNVWMCINWCVVPRTSLPPPAICLRLQGLWHCMPAEHRQVQRWRLQVRCWQPMLLPPHCRRLQWWRVQHGAMRPRQALGWGHLAARQAFAVTATVGVVGRWRADMPPTMHLHKMHLPSPVTMLCHPVPGVPGWADCDNDPSSGCETYTATDVRNCGCDSAAAAEHWPYPWFWQARSVPSVVCTAGVPPTVCLPLPSVRTRRGCRIVCPSTADRCTDGVCKCGASDPCSGSTSDRCIDGVCMCGNRASCPVGGTAICNSDCVVRRGAAGGRQAWEREE